MVLEPKYMYFMYMYATKFSPIIRFMKYHSMHGGLPHILRVSSSRNDRDTPESTELTVRVLLLQNPSASDLYSGHIIHFFLLFLVRCACA